MTHLKILDGGADVLGQNLQVGRAIHLPMDADQMARPLGLETAPQHDAATTMLDCRDGILGVVCSAIQSPNVTCVVGTKDLDLGLIRPENLEPVCHIVLGLRPATPEEEGQIIRGWLERESRHGLQVGHNWFLISMQWWQQWKEYVKYESKPVVIEPSPSLNGSRHSLGASSLDQREDDKTGTNVHSTTEEKSSDNISSASEASETTTSVFLYSSTPGADMCFARQHNTSDNNNQCMGGPNGSILLQLNPQKPGAIDNQPLVTQENVKLVYLQ
ncbi:unnamed protein product [Ranitomeya imitator]|uniref:ubiquitinyl hydrolase 1 n=1 Tax=Ranitomeya imitator TaxID=111125 RepID=A0ABN9KR54_9NEOB|nr:unnamed protein product [Ranitomeya imitator]